MLFKRLYFFIGCLLPLIANCENSTIWSGRVSADGTPSPVVKLKLGSKYQIQVSGTVNLGKWRRDGAPLENDACYEFGPKGSSPEEITNFKNSMNVTVGDGHFHPTHVYQSNPFFAAQNGIHFWVQDEDYEDNSGLFLVEIFELETAPVAIHPSP